MAMRSMRIVDEEREGGGLLSVLVFMRYDSTLMSASRSRRLSNGLSVPSGSHICKLRTIKTPSHLILVSRALSIISFKY
jgi:hypothetical protein